MQFHNGADTELTPYSCETCGQKYTRLDHLTRHIRSHTQERPFACEACGKAFARADLLKRHALGHEGDGLSKRQKTAASTRPRAARACIACARSKLRCDGVEPCSRCSKKNVACCYKNGGPINSVLRPSQVDLGQVNEVGRLDSPQTSVILQNISSGVHWRDLPTPVEPVEFVEEQGENQPSVEATTGSNIDFDDAYLADFLRDILNPTAQQLQQHGAANFEAQFAAKDFLDFTLPSSLEYIGDAFQMYQEDAPGAPIGHQVDANTKDPPAPSAGRSGYATPTGRNTGGLFLSAQAFSESLWLWTPQQGDHNKADRADLSLPVDALVSREKEGLGATPFPALEQRARDQVLATVLDICDRAMASVVVSCFPSAELLTILIHKFMVHHSSLTDNWCHFAQFDPNKEVPEMVICMASAGAALSKSPRLRRLGYAFQEAARTLNGLTFEADNRNIRKLKPIQCLTLLLDVGVWSGDRRKVEIAESFSQCLVNMVRRGGYFERIEDNTILPTLEDDQATLEMKWSTWIEKESFRRLVAHLLIRDNQTSASSLIPPLISYAEVSCALPMPRALWDAKTANDWAQLMRTTLPADAWGERVISVRSCLRDLPPAAACRRIDVDLTILIISHAIWGVCWQHRQIEAILRQDGDDIQKTGGFMSSSIEQIASQKVQQFRVEASEWSAFSSDATLACERILMNLYVSLEDVQLLAGKRGEKEARRTLSTLKHWAQSSASRQAVWHAGQVVRAASEYPPGTLREASAIAVYHAGLIFWAYAILVNASKPGPGNDIQASGQEVILNGESTPHLERFVMLGRGVPVLRIYTNTARIGHLVPVTEAKKVMGFMTELLQANNENRRDEPPPLVDNLNKLMRSLGNAARGIRD